MRQTIVALGLAGCVLVAVAACGQVGGPAPGGGCIPGASVSCVCPGNLQGGQACAADGASFGACVCGAGGSGGTSSSSSTATSSSMSGEDGGGASVDGGQVDAGTGEAGCIVEAATSCAACLGSTVEAFSCSGGAMPSSPTCAVTTPAGQEPATVCCLPPDVNGAPPHSCNGSTAATTLCTCLQGSGAALLCGGPSQITCPVLQGSVNATTGTHIECCHG